MSDAPDDRSSRETAVVRKRRRRMHPAMKIVLVLGVIVVLGFLFMRSLSDSRSEPYTVNRDHLRGWKVALEPSSNAGVLLALRASTDVVSDLFRQVFTRAMESLTRSADDGIPLVLRSEYERAFAGRVTPDGLAAAARDAGLETATLEPRCLGYRRISEPRSIRQVYFVVFEAPAFVRFREQIAAGSADFEPGAQSPVLFVAASDNGFGYWLPLLANPTSDCVAPIVIK